LLFSSLLYVVSHQMIKLSLMRIVITATPFAVICRDYISLFCAKVIKE